MLGTGTSRIYQNITSKHRSETAVHYVQCICMILRCNRQYMEYTDMHEYECMAGVDSDGVPTVNRDAYAGMS